MAAAAPAADAAAGMEIGVQDDRVFLGQTAYDPQLALAQAHALGVTRLRVNLVWPGGSPGRYDYAPYDRLIDRAASRGIRVQLTLTGGPAWAGGGPESNYNPSPRRFAAFASRVARHFRGRVDRYSIWNEPNWAGWLGPSKLAPLLYRRLYVAAYAAIKHADPRAQVLFGETSPYYRPRLAWAPLAFVRAALCVDLRWRRARRCATVRTDGFAQHPYDYMHQPQYRLPGQDNVTVGTLDRLETALQKLRRAGALETPRGGVPGIYLTEYGYFRSGNRAMPDGRRAVWLRRAFVLARRAPLVRELVQYQLVDPPVQGAWDMGIVSPDGQPSQPFEALKWWARVEAPQLARRPRSLHLPPPLR